jgi:catechol 2,3-dioxygenase-like lactoylglutathione lyase family enzyme
MCTMTSLGDYPAAAVLRAEDLARARRFYIDILGLRAGDVSGPASEDMGMFTAGQGSMIMIYERPGMPAPQNTALGFGIPADRFDDVVADLRAKGVTFEDYDLPEIGLKTVNGIAEFEGNKAAWFRDSEDNIVNIAAM